jgi:hypothetical protein
MLVRGLEPYVDNLVVGGERFGKGEILVTRFKRCIEDWESIDQKTGDVIKELKSPNFAAPRST